MKKQSFIFFALLSFFLFSCDNDENNLPEVKLHPSQLDFSVTQNPEKDNEITLENHMENVIPYWTYTNNLGDNLGDSHNNIETFTLPFANSYTIYFTAYTRGGAVEAEPVDITISQNDEEYFSEREWDMLTNGTEGKTWVLDMSSPVGWAGLDYPDDGDNWTWFPDYAGNEWVMENKDWGEISFNLDGGYNVSVTQTDLNSNQQTTENGSFSYDIEEHSMSFTNGVELLYGGDYYGDVSDWASINIAEISENSLRLAVLRDQSRSGEDNAQIIFHYTPKED